MASASSMNWQYSSQSETANGPEMLDAAVSEVACSEQATSISKRSVGNQ